MKAKKRMLALVLSLALILTLGITALAIDEGNTKGVVFSAQLSKSEVQVSEQEQSVVLTVSANKEIELDSLEAWFVTDGGIAVKKASMIDVPTDMFSTTGGKITWVSMSTEGNYKATKLFQIEFTIPANIAIGEHTIGVKNITVGQDGSLTPWEKTATATAVLTVVCPHTNKTEHAAVAETCTTAGNELYYTCDKCGKLLDQNGTVIETEPAIAAKGHDMTHYDALDPSCTERGNVEYWLCSRCNKTFADENGETTLDTTVIDASGHDYVHHDKVSASHAAAGMEEHYTCNHCELYFDAEKNVTTQAALVLPQVRHSFGDWVKTADDHKRTCVCGAVTDEGAHTFEWVVDRTATEEATGLKHEECTVCHYAKDGEEIPKLDHTHNMEHHAAAPATCTEDGTVEYWHCTKCGKDYADERGSTELTSVKEDAHGHDMTRHEAVPATCTEDGTREYWSCRHCNKKFADESGTEEIQNITVKASGHSYGEYVVTTPATCTEKGEETATCAKCQHKLTREINALGHSYGEYVVTTPATCTEKGEETATCAKCQHELTREINALGHSLGEYTVTKAPTCTEKGSKTATCSVCRAEITEEIPALDHKWDDGKVTKEATATEKGEKTYTCTECGETRTEEIPALGENAGVKTGDDTPVVLFALLGVLSAVGALVLTKKKAGQH